jgi:cell division protein FtsB
MPLPRQPRRSPGSAPTGRRPSVHRRTRDSVAEQVAAEQPHYTSLTSRAAILAVAICAVLLTVAVPLQSYIAQRAQIHDLRQQTSAARNRVADLEKQKQQWHDPAYIRQQARIRLHYVKPGQTAFVVIPPKKHLKHVTVQTTRTVTTSTSGPWYTRLWNSAVKAGKANG